ncbi:MAG: SIMPL domain-containing protein [Methanomicrobiales archaeon]|nr:SIMPL domain-containing protein [Methanomicrobiales archaeon]NYT21212.1 SIMPL domain-containing protein [Methanomicrobiales archaeon]
MKNRSLLLGTVFVLVLAILPLSAAAVDPALCPEKTLSVTGSGEIMATPDIALITTGVQTQNRDVRAAQADNARIMDGLISALVAAGISRDDIQTSGYSIYPVYDDDLPFGQKITSYQVTNSVRITVRDISRTGEIIDITVANGANLVNSISFRVSPEREQALRAEVLTMAVASARADADVVALATGTTITGVQSVSIGSVYTPVLYDNRMAAGAATKEAAVPTPIEPGQVTVTAQVSITYLIR